MLKSQNENQNRSKRNYRLEIIERLHNENDKLIANVDIPKLI